MNHMHEVGKTVERCIERYLSFIWKNIRHKKDENSLNPDERSPFFFRKFMRLIR